MFFVALFAICAGLAAQVRVDVRLVNIIATVTDESGRYVGSLTADDFVVQEDGAPQKISHFSQDHDVPVSVGIILDTSGSMERKIRTAVDAVDHFIRRTHEDDEIFLMTFSSEPMLRQDFTNDRSKLSQALRKMWVTGGTPCMTRSTRASRNFAWGATKNTQFLLSQTARIHRALPSSMRC